MAICVINHFKVGSQPTQTDLMSPQVLAGDDDLGNYSLVDFSLEKDLLTPNVFRFTMRRNKIAKSDETIKFSVASSLIGKEVDCEVEAKLEGNTSKLKFKGSIFSATMQGLNIACVAKSKDSCLMGAPKSRCFTNKYLVEIVNSISKDALTIIHKSFNDLQFPYIVQYNESDYDFLVRLAKRFGAFLYYEEKKGGLVFGKPANDEGTIELTPPEFGRPEGDNISFKLQMGNPNVKFIAHDYETNTDISSTMVDFDRDNYGGMFKMAAKGSVESINDNNYKFYLDDPNSLPDNNTDLMTKYHKVMQGCFLANMTVCKCVIYRLDIHVGSYVKFKENLNGADVDSDLMLVTSSHITWNCKGMPQNEITAMILPKSDTSADDIFAPYFDINAYPKSSAQRAEVFDNVDPEKMGRVQVFFSWQKDLSDEEKKALPWIRIAQPYSGKDKGFYVIPEKKEEVMVGFEHNNMEKPFVIGSLYHNSDDAQQKHIPADDWCEVPAANGQQAKNEDNEVKAFRTSKGHTIEFHDTKQGDGFIRIYGNNNSDKENYDIILSTDKIQKKDGENKNYVLNSADNKAEASKDISGADYNAEKLRIMVRSNGGDIMLDAGAEGSIFLNAKNIHINATGDSTTHIKGKNVLKVDGDQLADVGSNSLVVQKDQAIKVKGNDNEEYIKDVNVKVTEALKVNAKTLNSETEQKTAINAASVAVEAKQDAAVTAKTGLTLDGGVNVDMKADTGITVKGAQVMLEGTGAATLKGSSVLIDAAAGTRKGTWTDL